MRPRRTLDRPVEFEFMSLPEWQEFLARLSALLDRSELRAASIDGGRLILEDGRSVGLLDLAQLCHLGGRSTWDDIMSRHLGILWAHLGPTPEDLSSFDLRIRLVPDVPTERDLQHQMGARPFAEGVVAHLAARVDGAVRPVSESDLHARGWNVGATWEGAWAQTRTLERPSEQHVIDVGDADIVSLFSEHFFGASFVPFVDDVCELPPHGAVVSMPVRHSVLVHPIHGGDVIPAIQAMIPLTRQVFRGGPGSVSPHLYWWQAGHLSWIPTYLAADAVEFYPPQEFAELIDALDDHL